MLEDCQMLNARWKYINHMQMKIVTSFFDELLFNSSINFWVELFFGESLFDEFELIRKLGFMKSWVSYFALQNVEN